MRKSIACLSIAALPLLACGCNEFAVTKTAANVAGAAIQQAQVNAQIAEAAEVDRKEANKQLFMYTPEVEAQLKELRATMKAQQEVAAAQFKAAGIKTKRSTTRPSRPVPGTVVGSR